MFEVPACPDFFIGEALVDIRSMRSFVTFEIRAALCTAALLAMAMPGCTVRHPLIGEDVSPSLSALRVPEALYLASDIAYPLTVRAEDPQGYEDITSVIAVISDGGGAVLWQDTLRDDGMDGDIIGRDGLFWTRIPVAFAGGQAGVYPVSVQAADFSFNASDALSDSVHVFEGRINFPPVLSRAVVPDSMTEDRLDSLFFSVEAADDSLAELDSVCIRLYPETSPVPVWSQVLLDNGTGGDVVAGDSVFSLAADLTGKLSHVPVLSQLSMPDTVSRTVGTLLVLSVRVQDAAGLQDVKSVYFNTTKPDGSASGGNPFLMYDDGDVSLHGDAVAGDGRYSLKISIASQNATGNYRFDFYAEDYSQGFNSCLVRFQGRDRRGGASDPLLFRVPVRLRFGTGEALTHILTVVQ